eukprot:g4132.t1
MRGLSAFAFLLVSGFTASFEKAFLARALSVNGQHQQFHDYDFEATQPPPHPPPRMYSQADIAANFAQLNSEYRTYQADERQKAANSIDEVCGPAGPPPFYLKGEEPREQWKLAAGGRGSARDSGGGNSQRERSGRDGATSSKEDETSGVQRWLAEKLHGTPKLKLLADAGLLPQDEAAARTELSTHKVKKLGDACVALAVLEAAIDGADGGGAVEEEREGAGGAERGGSAGDHDRNRETTMVLYEQGLSLWREHFSKSQYADHRCRHFFLAKQLQKDAVAFRIKAEKKYECRGAFDFELPLSTIIHDLCACKDPKVRSSVAAFLLFNQKSANATLWESYRDKLRNKSGNANADARTLAYSSFYQTALGASPEWATSNRDLLELQLHTPHLFRCYSRLAFVRPPVFVWPVMLSTQVALSRLQNDKNMYWQKCYKHFLYNEEYNEDVREDGGRKIDDGNNRLVAPAKKTTMEYAMDSSYVFEYEGSGTRSYFRKLRFARVDQLQHLSVVKHLITAKFPRSLNKSPLGDNGNSDSRLLPDFVEQVVEFGGGTGELVALVAEEAAFNSVPMPRYVIYDTPPMLHLQKYFLRLSGFPARLAAAGSLASSASTRTDVDLDRRQIWLTPSTVFDSDLELLKKATTSVSANKTLVVGFYSLSEAPAVTRKRFLHAVWPPAAIYLLELKADFFDKENFETCCWSMGWFGRDFAESANSYYFIATRKDLALEVNRDREELSGEREDLLRCDPDIGCNEGTLVQELSSCRVESEVPQVEDHSSRGTV